MKIRRLLWRSANVLIFTLITLAAVWRIFQVEEHLRIALQEYLHNRYNLEISIASLDIKPNAVRMERLALDFPPNTSLIIEKSIIHFFPLDWVRTGMTGSGAIRSVELKGITVLTGDSSNHSSGDGKAAYPPYPFKGLKALKIVRRIALSDGVIISRMRRESLLEGIKGDLAIDESGRMTGDFSANLSFLPQSKITADLHADLDRGDLLAALSLSGDDLSQIRLPRELTGLHDYGGRLTVQTELRGTDELRLTGSVAVNRLRASYGEAFQIRDGSLNGSIFGTGFELSGWLNVNGIQLPVEFNLTDITNPNWAISIPDTVVDLAQFYIEGKDLPQIDGLGDLAVNIAGRPGDWGGKVAFAAPIVRAAGLVGRNLSIDADILHGIVSVSRGELELFGGRFNSSARLDGRAGHHHLKWAFNRKWNVGKGATWFRTNTASLNASGTVRFGVGELKGDGGIILIGDGDTLLNGRMTIVPGGFAVTVHPHSGGAALAAEIILKKGTPFFHFATDDPQQLAAAVLPPGTLPEFLNGWTIALDITGNIDSLHYLVVWRTAGEEGGGTLLGDYIHQNEAVRLDGKIAINLAQDWDLEGDVRFIGSRRQRQGFVKLRDVQGRPTLIGEAIWNQGDGIRPGDWRADLEQLPLFEIIRHLLPDALHQTDGSLTGRLAGRGDEIKFTGSLMVDYPDKVKLKLETDGHWRAGILAIDKLYLADPIVSDTLLTADGRIDFQRRTISHTLLQTHRLPLQRIISPFTPALAKGLNIPLNGRFETAGQFDSLSLFADAHFSNGTIFGLGGYWANLNCRGEGGIIQLERLNFGRGLSTLFNLSGIHNRHNGKYTVQMESKTIDLRDIHRLITGADGKLSGAGTINAIVTGDRSSIGGSLKLSFAGGKLGPMPYDRLTADARLVTANQNIPRFELDSLVVDWGDVKGRVNGLIPLISEQVLNLNGWVEGRLASLLVRLDRFFSRPVGTGRLAFHIGGTIGQLKLAAADLNLKSVGFQMKDVIAGVDDLYASIVLDSSGRVDIERFEGKIQGTPFRFSNRFPADNERIESIDLGLVNLGIIGFSTGDDGIWMVIPSLMERSWGGSFAFSGPAGGDAFEFRGPAERLSGVGRVTVRNATITYPLLKGAGKPSPFVKSLLRTLARTKWDAVVVPAGGCRYLNRIAGLGGLSFMETLNRNVPDLLRVDLPLTVDLLIDDNPNGLHFSGALADSLRLNGELTSTQGGIEYLDLDFRVDRVSVAFNPSDTQPLLSGMARTTVMDTSVIPPIQREVRLVVQGRPTRVGTAVAVSDQGGRLEDIRIRLEDDQGHSQEQILAMMGYTPEGIATKLSELGGTIFEQAVPLRQWTRFIEQRMQRWLRVDRLAIEPVIARNIIEGRTSPELGAEADGNSGFSYLNVLDQSRLTVGKYLTRDLFLAYTGSLLSGTDAVNVTRLGVVHIWDMLIRLTDIDPNLNLQYSFYYNSLAKSSDNSIRVSYRFFVNW